MKWSIGLLAILSFGCMANSGVVEPYAYAPKSQSTLYGMPLDLTSLNLQDRKEPLQLAELVDIALRNNPSTRLTWAKARAAAAVWAQSQSPNFPTLSGTYTIERDKSTTVTTGAATQTAKATTNVVFSQLSTTWGPEVQLSYTLLDFGLTSANVRSAKEALISADFSHNYQIQTVLNQVASDYYNYLSQQQQLKAQEADLDTAQVTLDAVNAEVKAGVKDKSDLLQAQTQFFQTQINLVNQRQNVVNAKAVLFTDIGLGAEKHLAVADTLEVPPIDQMEQNVDTILAVALSMRSDLLAAEASLRSQQAAVDATWRQFLPNVTYDLSVYQSRAKPGGDLGIQYSGILALNYPIFSGFSTVNQYREAKSIRDQAAATLRQTELTVVEQVVTSHAAVRTAFEALHFADQLLVAAQEQYDVALKRYKAGVGTIIELVTAQNTLAVSRAENVSSTTNWLSSLVNLSYAAGTLVPTSKEVQ
jgi:outer membrane protein